MSHIGSSILYGCFTEGVYSGRGLLTGRGQHSEGKMPSTLGGGGGWSTFGVKNALKVGGGEYIRKAKMLVVVVVVGAMNHPHPPSTSTPICSNVKAPSENVFLVKKLSSDEKIGLINVRNLPYLMINHLL